MATVFALCLTTNKENALEVFTFGLSLAVGAGVHVAAEELAERLRSPDPNATQQSNLGWHWLAGFLPVAAAFTAMTACVFMIAINFEGQEVVGAARHSFVECLKPIIALAFLGRLGK